MLTDAAAQGRLPMSEYEDRLTRAYAAQTYDELDRISADLPGSGRSLPPPGETSIMYWEKVSAKPDSGRASTQSRVPCQWGR